MLLDSNILIYSVRAEFSALREFLVTDRFSVSTISLVEVLGYHRWVASELVELEAMIEEYTAFAITAEIIDRAIKLRRIRKMGLGDSIIAATALIHGKVLVTANVKDFQWIDGLRLLNPLTP